MGWHSGMLVANAPWDAFAAALHDATGAEIGTVTSRDASRDVAFGGELGGRAYVCDPTLLLTADGDRAVELSRTLHALVIDGGAETISGTYWLFAAERGELLRAFFACVSDLDAAFDRGTWGGTIDLDEDGVLDAIAEVGFDVDAFMKDGVKRPVTEPDSGYRDAKGPIDAEMAAFHAAHRLPKIAMHTRSGLWSRVRRLWS